MKNQLIRIALVIPFAVFSWYIAPTGCSNMTPDQITATTNAITSVETTTGQIVVPLVVHYQNGQSVKVKKPKPTPTPKP